MSDDPKPEDGEEQQEQGDNPLAPEPGSTLPDEENGDEDADDDE